ncbi:gp53-like domain-containing protein [Photorhabdus khanii]|uniref:Phage tail protein n=1 Tax=Photorhabdus khanii subsp. guanajuatensis TaxID=2100166 RepID=A0A4R4K323_9GAMM|nr:phage tail protein [Photorhabdus khanii]TDB61708.1 phage tail protein [Photorhabdus khanii subsp. guanajuatensis]
MSPKNDFKAFSVSNNANVINQERYEESQSLQTGFPPENIPIHVLNKALRQSSTISSVVANFIATQSGDNVLDDGDITKLTAQLNKALGQKIKTEFDRSKALLSINGWWKCGDTGIIIQWGQANGSMSENDYRNFTIPFPNACGQIVATYSSFGNYGLGVAAFAVSASQFILTCRDGAGSLANCLVRYLAIGY